MLLTEIQHEVRGHVVGIDIDDVPSGHTVTSELSCQLITLNLEDLALTPLYAGCGRPAGSRNIPGDSVAAECSRPGGDWELVLWAPGVGLLLPPPSHEIR